MALTLAERFEAKVLRQDGDLCHPWVGTLHEGYGEIRINYKKELAHRVAWFLHHGTWPVGILRHTCDKPRCVRISHLIDGTRGQNSRDMVLRGRSKRGQRWNTVLSSSDLLLIRQLDGKMPKAELAEKFGVSESMIYKVLSGLRR